MHRTEVMHNTAVMHRTEVMQSTEVMHNTEVMHSTRVDREKTKEGKQYILGKLVNPIAGDDIPLKEPRNPVFHLGLSLVT